MRAFGYAIWQILRKGWHGPCPISTGPQKVILGFQKSFLFWVSENPIEYLEGWIRNGLFHYHLNPNTDSVLTASLFLEVFRNLYYIYVHATYYVVVLHNFASESVSGKWPWPWHRDFTVRSLAWGSALQRPSLLQQQCPSSNGAVHRRPERRKLFRNLWVEKEEYVEKLNI